MPLTMVLPDANVLVSKTTRDWLFLLAQECQGMFTVHYTVDIMVETLRTVRRQNPTLDGAAITALMKKIEESSRSRLDEYPADPGYPGSDPHDQSMPPRSTTGSTRF